MISKSCRRCRAYALGWCEYDPNTDTIYPNNEDECRQRLEESMAELQDKPAQARKEVLRSE